MQLLLVQLLLSLVSEQFISILFCFIKSASNSFYSSLMYHWMKLQSVSSVISLRTYLSMLYPYFTAHHQPCQLSGSHDRGTPVFRDSGTIWEVLPGGTTTNSWCSGSLTFLSFSYSVTLYGCDIIVKY